MYKQKNNPLRGIEVKTPNFCADRNHLWNVLTSSFCETCLRSHPFPTADQSAFERLNVLKTHGV